MAVLKVELKQHTPIIHFQYFQEGATLRASELKPKLDKFLISKFKNNNIDYKKWLIGNGEPEALNYKLKIFYGDESWEHYIEDPKTNDNNEFRQKQNDDGTYSTETFQYPLFFGNMGKNYSEDRSIKKFVLANDKIKLDFRSFISHLVDTIKNNFHEFIAQENFGSRQDKGFGSFYIDKGDVNYKSLNENLFDYKFEITAQNNHDLAIRFKSIFNQVDLFYRALRSGINTKAHDRVTTTFYFKSLLFLYFKNQNIQWEKKTIKEKFFINDGLRRDGSLLYYGLNTQKTYLPSSDALTYSNNNKKLVKDLLGLSTEESWIYYKNSITKTEAKLDKNNNIIKKEKKEDQIERFKSPIFFKIIESDTAMKYIVYIKLFENNHIKGKWFIIDSKYGRNSSLPLQIPNNFSLHNFFEFITDKTKFNISTHVEKGFQTDSKGNLNYQYETLKNIFDSLKIITQTSIT